MLAERERFLALSER